MNVRRTIRLGVILGGLLFGLSCAGPDDTSKSRTEDDDRVFHVQVGMTEDKAAANALMGEAMAWWSEHSSEMAPTPLSSSNSARRPVQVYWKPPLYRVRLGPFSNRSAANTVASAAQSSFPDAFVAPERPTDQRDTP